MRRICVYSPHDVRRICTSGRDQNGPEFSWDTAALLEPLATARLKQGQLLGNMARLGFHLKLEAELAALTEDVIKTSEIEGETLDRNSVRSFLPRRLGVPDAGVTAVDRRAEGVVEMMLDATQNYLLPLMAHRFPSWQSASFPTGFSGLHMVLTGAWRTDVEGSMQVVWAGRPTTGALPGATGLKERARDCIRFLAWFNGKPTTEGLLRAGLAHLWFVTLHPFEDGNGRIARAIADQALAQSEEAGPRPHSVSSQIRVERKQYSPISRAGAERRPRCDGMAAVVPGLLLTGHRCLPDNHGERAQKGRLLAEVHRHGIPRPAARDAEPLPAGFRREADGEEVERTNQGVCSNGAARHQ